jgi:hypothetical protein
MASRLQCNYSRLPIGGSDRVKERKSARLYILRGLVAILGTKRRTFAPALAAMTWPLVARADDVGLVSK